jgi:hypothetical protein
MVRTESLHALFLHLHEHTGFSLDTSGFTRMSDAIGEELVSKRYLGDVYRMLLRSRDQNKTEFRTHRDKLDHIARFLKYRNFQRFEDEIARPLSPALASCTGNWWSIVRANAGPYLLKAPVRISRDEKGTGLIAEMKASSGIFTGSVMLRAGNLFIELDSGHSKKLYIILKIGVSQHPSLLQGIFAGMSTAGDPIAGREILLRETDLAWDSMKWAKRPIDPSGDPIHRYFDGHEKNCIRIGSVSAFDLTDLH